jgi:hypothetical protein
VHFNMPYERMYQSRAIRPIQNQKSNNPSGIEHPSAQQGRQDPQKKSHTTSARSTGASKQDRSPARTWLNMAPPP